MSDGERFSCTPGGAIAGGRRRLRWLLGALALLMLAFAGGLFWAGRLLPAVLCLAVAALCRLTWKMSGDLLALWLALEPGRLVVRTRRHLLREEIGGGRARALTGDELEHLRRLASMSGVTAFSGGFDSHRLGEFELYATHLDNAVLVDAGESRWVLTPDDPDAFLAAFERAAEGSHPATIPRS